MIRWPRSPRVCDADAAAGDRRRSSAAASACVGVFVNATLDELAHEAEAIGFSHLQLHGDEGPPFCAEVARRTGCKIIKAARVAHRGRHPRARALPHRLPPARRRRGRTCAAAAGDVWDWDLLAARRSKVPLILSGGLDPDNVAEAIAATQPYAVDSASRHRERARASRTREKRSRPLVEPPAMRPRGSDGAAAR